MINCDELKKRIGFTGNSNQRLIEAITHRSYAVENNLKYDNQRLEFLGDAVLELILTEYLYDRYPDAPEGDLTKIRSGLVCEASLAAIARHIDLGKYLRIGRGEAELKGNTRDSTLADLFEAVLGALYFDSGYEKAKNFVITELEAVCSEPKQLLAELNPKGLLQELSQRRWGETPVYTVLRVIGPQHQPFYEMEVKLHCFVALGSGSSRKAAQMDAAKKLYLHLTKK